MEQQQKFQVQEFVDGFLTEPVRLELLAKREVSGISPEETFSLAIFRRALQEPELEDLQFLVLLRKFYLHLESPFENRQDLIADWSAVRDLTKYRDFTYLITEQLRVLIAGPEWFLDEEAIVGQANLVRVCIRSVIASMCGPGISDAKRKFVVPAGAIHPFRPKMSEE